MEGLRTGVLLAAATLLFAAAMLPEVAAVRYIVGDKYGWSPAYGNFTLWAQNHTFYNGDWLFFVYDRNQMNILEVNKTDYELCNSDHPLHNWTTGAGRDVVPLNVTRTYYFLSGKGFCFSGMKVAVHVLNPPPPPKALPEKSGSTARFASSFRSRVLLPALFAGAVAWESLLMLL